MVVTLGSSLMSLVANAGLFIFRRDCGMKVVVMGVPSVLVLATPIAGSITWMGWPNWYLVSYSKIDFLRASIDNDASMMI
jgi:hypothetical protein